MVEAFVYDDLKSAIDKARAKTAKFHRVDLHVHTIGSHDFPSVHSKLGFVKKVPTDEKGLKKNPDEFRRRFVQRAKDQRLRLVAVTDHNESDMAEQLSAMSVAELTILPGIEISVQTSLFPDSEVHLFGIFPQGTSSKQIDKVFPAGCGMPPSGQRKKGAHTTQPISEIIKTIRNLGGICIAAHVDSTGGVRTMVHSQNVERLQKNYLRMYLNKKRVETGLFGDESEHLRKLEEELKPLDDEVQNAYLTFLAEHEFNAIQIREAEHQQFYTGDHVDMLNLFPFPCVLSSDAHTLTDLGCPGHGTHIKMAGVGLDGLRKAFGDPVTRIRYDTTVPTERPKRILGVAFEGGSFDGQVIGFSDNLTTLIGGRGTGKSALIEAMRFVLCQPIDGLPDRLRGDIEERRDFTLRETEVKLLFADQQQGELFVLKRRLGESRTSCFTLDGKPLPEIELPTSQRIRAEIYGWSEIEELSDSPRKQIAMLDRTVPGIDGLQLEMQSRVEELRVNGERVVALAREIQDFLPHTEGAEDVRQQLESLGSPELNEAFASFDRNEAGLRALGTLGKEIEDANSWLLDQGQKRKLDQDLSEALQEAKESLQDYSWYAQFSQMIGENSAELQRLYGQLLATLDSVKDEIDIRIAELQQERDSIEAQLNVLAEKSGQGDFKTALSRRKELTAKMSKILSFEKDIQEKQTDIDQLLDTRYTQIVPALTSARGRMYQARLAKANAIANKLAELRAASGINIEIEPMGDVEAFSRLLGHREKSRTAGLFKGIDKHYLSKDYPGFYSRKFSPHEFVAILLEEMAGCGSLVIRFIRKRSDQTGEIVRLVGETVEEEGGELVEYGADGAILGKWASSGFELVEMEDAEKVWKYLSPWYYDDEINGHYDPQKLKNLLELELSDIEDRPRILLDGKPIEGLSPGQRCSALIPIILVEGQNPLVIDQPEDNLDNKLVFDLVVDILRGLKEQRQIIVATHNPNIPVSGDAEQVVVFESPSKEQCCVVEQGSIDDEAIVQHVKTVMEGGDRAFKIRMRKYGLLGSM